MAVHTRSSSPGSAWAALAAGAASVATLPVAIYLTRFSEAYELLHAGLAIPLAGLLAVAALRLARRASLRTVLRLDPRPDWRARAGRILGLLGLFLAASAVVALVVYVLLEYVGSR